jgi:hypothetical protein
MNKHEVPLDHCYSISEKGINELPKSETVLLSAKKTSRLHSSPSSADTPTSSANTAYAVDAADSTGGCGSRTSAKLQFGTELSRLKC